MSRQIILTCVDAGGGHACGLALGLKKYGDVRIVYQNRNPHGLDYLNPDAKYGLKNIPKSGDDLVIVSCITYVRIKKEVPKVLKGYERIHVVITDGRYAREPDYFNSEFKGYDVLTTGCKYHFRQPLPVRTYYQPFDLSLFRINKNKELTVAHSPFGQLKRREKGTDEIQRITKQEGVKFDLITGVQWKECIKRKAVSHIFVDQIDHYDRDAFKFKSPDYIWPALGKSGIEAMHLKCLTITHGQGYDTDIPAPPVAWCVNDTFEEVFKYYITHEKEREELAEKQYAWASRYATYDFAAKNVLG